MVSTTFVETLDEFGYTGCMLGRAPRKKETLSDFL